MLLFETPPPELAQELAEVKHSARELIDHLERGLNFPLPRDFPKETIISIAKQLAELEEGTAKGCVRPLSYGDQQLSEIRSQYIAIEGTSKRSDSRESPPLLSRGEGLDYFLIKLLSAISTARRVADRIAAVESAEEKPEPSVSRSNDPQLYATAARAKAAEATAVDTREALDRIRDPQSELAESLRRKITDAKVLSGLGRLELSQPRLIPGWVERIGITLSEYPKIIERSGRALRYGVDIADRTHHHVIHFEQLTFSALTTVLRGVAADFESLGKKLRESRKKPFQVGGEVAATEVVAEKPALLQSVEAEESGATPPVDFTIGKTRQMILSGKTPPKNWWPFIDELSFSGESVVNMECLGPLPLLRKLDLSSSGIESITELRELHNLEKLSLKWTVISDLSSLARLTELKELDLWGTSVSDLRPLASLKKLRILNLGATRVDDLTPLSGLTGLQVINLFKTSVTSIAPLSDLKELEIVNLQNTAVTDISPLVSLQNLRILDVTAASVANLAILGRRPGLQILGRR